MGSGPRACRGDGYLVSAWTDVRPDGEPDSLCRVVRDEHAERGAAVVRLSSRDGSGTSWSRLDIELDTTASRPVDDPALKIDRRSAVPRVRERCLRAGILRRIFNGGDAARRAWAQGAGAAGRGGATG